jgi:NAD(P)H-dependent flavin oxidoreductase YrpB (nitropropane dioxygenase family)
VPVNAGRRFSQAISEGDGISLIATVAAAEDAARVEEHGAEAVLVPPGSDGALEQIRAATSLPVLIAFPAGRAEAPAAADACLVDADEDLESLASRYGDLAEACELAFRIEDEDRLEAALEEFDPEIFVLAAPGADGDEALERVLDLLPDVPAGKLAIAELSGPTRDDVGALERAGFDGVIVEPRSVAGLVGHTAPEV